MMSSGDDSSDEGEVVDYVESSDDDDFEMIYHEPPSIDMKELDLGQDYRTGFQLVIFDYEPFILFY